MRVASTDNPLSVVVLISGSGTNLQAIIDYIREQELPIEIRAVISNNPEAYGLKRATEAGIPVEVVNHRDYQSREYFDQALRAVIDQYKPELIVLAGFMRILTDDFVRRYQGRMINIHPSLLPKYQGLNTHQRVLEAGDSQHGVSVHFVTPELDGGPVIIQATVPVKEDDTPQSLAERIHEQEYLIYPLVIQWFAEGRLQLRNDEVLFNGKPITDSQRRFSL